MIAYPKLDEGNISGHHKMPVYIPHTMFTPKSLFQLYEGPSYVCNDATTQTYTIIKHPRGLYDFRLLLNQLHLILTIFVLISDILFCVLARRYGNRDQRDVQTSHLLLQWNRVTGQAERQWADKHHRFSGKIPASRLYLTV